jgi:ABC-type dipeptide/oligopeptide/nickel transport system permease subunit
MAADAARLAEAAPHALLVPVAAIALATGACAALGGAARRRVDPRRAG